MPKSRTVRVLTALFVTMTLGALVLMMLETGPIRGGSPAVWSVPTPAQADPVDQAIRFDTEVPVQPAMWRNVVVHASGFDADASRQCHFLVAADGTVRNTILWKRQMIGRHTFGIGRDWNADSIGIFVEGDFSTDPPPAEQFRSLLRLVRSLQEYLGPRQLPADHVYLSRDVDPQTRSPGDAFPAAEFDRLLLRPTG